MGQPISTQFPPLFSAIHGTGLWHSAAQWRHSPLPSVKRSSKRQSHQSFTLKNAVILNGSLINITIPPSGILKHCHAWKQNSACPLQDISLPFPEREREGERLTRGAGGHLSELLGGLYYVPKTGLKFACIHRRTLELHVIIIIVFF